MVQRILQILLLLVFTSFFSANAFAATYCQLARVQATTAESWELSRGKNSLIPLHQGRNVFTIKCDLTQDGVLTFQRPGLISHHLDISGEHRSPIPTGQIAYVLPMGQFEGVLTLEAEVNYTPRFRWHHQQDFVTASQQHNLIMGGFYGLGFTLVLLSLLIGWKIKAPTLRWYGFYILSLTLFLLLQEGQLFIFFSNEIAQIHKFAYLLSIGFTVLSASWFFSNFLYLKQDFPYVNRTILVLSSLVFVCALLRALFAENLPLFWIGAIMGYGTLLIVAAIFIVSLVQAYRGAREAGLICIALSIVLLSLLFRIVFLNYNPFMQRYGFILALAIESIILALALAQRVSRITHEKDIAEQAANFDPLCGIANRRGLNSRLAKLAESDPEDQMLYAAFYIDADDFKSINDNYGHNVGDLALQNIAACLAKNMRQHDVYGRLGGDEFIAIASFRSVDEVHKKHTELKLTMSRVTFKLGNIERTVTASVGCAIFEALPANLDEIISASDRSMYIEKNSRKLGVV